MLFRSYVWRTFVLPGGRKNFDGTPRVLRDPGPDADWFSGDGPMPATAAALTRARTLTGAGA